MEAAGSGKPGNRKGGGKSSKNNGGEAIPAVISPLESWIFSTASCYHVTSIQDIMENYTAGNFGKVYDAFGNSMDVVGKGDVHIKLSSNATWVLHDVKHVPCCCWNMISVGQLCGGSGYRMMCSTDGWEVSSGDFTFTVPHDPNPPNRITVLTASP